MNVYNFEKLMAGMIKKINTKYEMGRFLQLHTRGYIIQLQYFSCRICKNESDRPTDRQTYINCK